MGFPFKISFYRVPLSVRAQSVNSSKIPMHAKEKQTPKRANAESDSGYDSDHSFPQIYRAGVDGGYPQSQICLLSSKKTF